uniref:Ovarian-specific serine/threonine-protein kinase Lok-like n=1 Tax=Diabrotica virgifera virgifera TaxID=50390 RepID=A0A6P7G6G0_DIAVI
MENVASNSQDSNKWGRLISCIPTLKSVAINKDSFKLGRSLSCDIIVTESNFSQNTLIGTISKEHFLIFKKPCSTYAYLQDLSKNGTYVNGTKVERGKSVCLRTGDKIAIGQRMNSVYTFQSLLQEELPDTLTPLTHLENTPTYTEVLPIWGRLLSCLLFLKSFDIHQDRFKVGRSEKCDVSISHTTLRQEYKDLFSKEHFIICKDSTSKVVYIKDMSKSGTYLNNRLIGKHNMNILQHDDKISIGPKLEIGWFNWHICDAVLRDLVIFLMATILQPFIISMQHIVETPMDVYIVLDYMRGGELTNRILSNEPMTESNVKFLFYQMVLAVDYLHTKGITHRDLKPENVLLHSEDVETLLKVSDFGLSKVTEEDDMMKTICGTLSYIAPEILNRQIREYNRQVDVWSLGVILFYMLGKRLPFKSPDRAIMEKNIINGYYTFEDEKWEDISSEAKDLVREMLTVEPEERITVINILKHQWLSKDLNMKIRVNQLYHSHLENMEENITPFDNEPSAKRSRSSSDESSTSQ